MPRPARNQLSPWIENLILSFDSRPRGGCGGGGRLKAHVVGVGRMTQSQALSCDGLSGLLFLSDGTLQIPAVLSSAAWERVQEQEERESFSSLLNTTVFIRHYQLRFHRSSLQTRSRFFLSVGEVSTTAAGPVRDNPPCSTSLASVRLKICQTWRSLQELQELQEPESQTSQSGLDLTELLDEWQHDCVQEVLDQLRSCTSASRLAHQDAATTGWDVDRIRHKGEEPFSVPVRCLLIPDDDDDPQQPPTPPDAGDGARLSPASKDRETNLVHGHTTGPPVDDAEWTMAPTAADENSTLPVDSCVPHEDMMPLVIDSDLMPPSNPWDIFPPPSTTSSSSDASPEATPTDALHRRRSGPAAMVTSTQLPVSQLTSDDSKGGQSSVPPYQKLAHSTHLPTSTSTSITPASASASVSRPGPTDLSPAADRHVARTSRQDGMMWGTDTTETLEGKYRKVKKKRSDPTAEASPVAVEEQIIDPPSWLFDTQAGSEVKEVGGHKKGQGSGSALRKIPRVHSDGRPFSYCYGVTGQNLRDLSRFRVAESALHWAVRYLVPKQ